MIVPFIIMISEDDLFQYHVGIVEGYDALTAEMTSQKSQQLYEDLLQMITAYESHHN